MDRASYACGNLCSSAVDWILASFVSLFRLSPMYIFMCVYTFLLIQICVCSFFYYLAAFLHTLTWIYNNICVLLYRRVDICMRFNEMLISALLLCNRLPQNIMPSTTASFLVIRWKSFSLARLLSRARICVCRFRFSFLLYPLSSFRVCSFLSSRFGFRSVEYFSVRIY